MTQAFPLQWPKGRPRTKKRSDSRFKVQHSQAYDEMMQELHRWGVSGIVVSCNIPIRRDGSPYRDGLTELLDDPGVAVYFQRKKQPAVIVCDTYRRPWENCRALGLAVKAMRDMDRHGATQVLDQMFEGFAALPPPDQMSEPSSAAWWFILDVAPNATADQIKQAYKDRAREKGGASRELNAAKVAGLAAVGG